MTVDLKASLDPDHVGDVGIPASAALLAFTNAVERGGGNNTDEINAARSALVAEIGEPAALEAAAIIAIFNGLVRVADGTGIQLDEGVFTASVDERDLLGIDRFAGAANSADVQPVVETPSEVADLFG